MTLMGHHSFDVIEQQAQAGDPPHQEGWNQRGNAQIDSIAVV